MFSNPLDEQNSKMSLGGFFMEKTKKTSYCKLQKIAGTGAYFRHSHSEMAVIGSTIHISLHYFIALLGILLVWFNCELFKS